ncbi:hypothetical protein CCHR01_10689 [Colletotrichum chrysophilum]|uniref:Uncharacterized protein n=1 Tax=Colletotrichum chrysophilum TaxID=1836956 RepID=A0AAD9AEE7_9PEZI|nr:hypothetical protein CCHR01_10689 [Colletotrichum chrysophilum]
MPFPSRTSIFNVLHVKSWPLSLQKLLGCYIQNLQLSTARHLSFENVRETYRIDNKAGRWLKLPVALQPFTNTLIEIIDPRKPTQLIYSPPTLWSLSRSTLFSVCHVLHAHIGNHLTPSIALVGHAPVRPHAGRRVSAVNSGSRLWTTSNSGLDNGLNQTPSCCVHARAPTENAVGRNEFSLGAVPPGASGIAAIDIVSTIIPALSILSWSNEIKVG